MGYQIISTPDFESVLNGLNIDLSFANSGIFTTLYTTNDQVKAQIKDLLLTRVGERYAQVLFGTNLLNILFQPNNQFIKEDIQEEINSAVDYWLPFVTILSIDIITAEDDPSYANSIKITITYQVNDYETEKITIISGENKNITIE